MADKVMEVATPSVAAINQPQAPLTSDPEVKRLKEEVSQLAELVATLTQQRRPRRSRSIQRRHSSFCSTRPLRPHLAIFADAPSVPKPTSLVQCVALNSVIPRLERACLTHYSRPEAVPDGGLRTQKYSVLVCTISSLPLVSRNTTMSISFSVLLLSVLPSINREKYLALASLSASSCLFALAM